jgi:hypothetical protein
VFGKLASMRQRTLAIDGAELRVTSYMHVSPSAVENAIRLLDFPDGPLASGRQCGVGFHQDYSDGADGLHVDRIFRPVSGFRSSDGLLSEQVV